MARKKMPKDWQEVNRLLDELRVLADQVEEIKSEVTAKCAELNAEANRKLQPLQEQIDEREQRLKAFLAAHLPDAEGRSSVLLPNGKVWVKTIRSVVLNENPADEGFLKRVSKVLPDAVRTMIALDRALLKRKVLDGELPGQVLGRLGIEVHKELRPGYKLTRVPREIPSSR